MLDWIRSIWQPTDAKPQRFVEIGQAGVLIVENDGTEHEIEFCGKYSGKFPGTRNQDWVFDAEFYFKAWQTRSGETGMCYVGDNKYVPLCNIRAITVEYTSKEIPVE